MLPPRPLLAVCLLLLGGLAWTVGGQDPPVVAIPDADRWEGQAVTIEGWALSVRADAGGLVRLDLVDGSAAVGLRIAGKAGVEDGDRVAATGRLTRSAGSLVLMVDDADDLHRVGSPGPAHPTWDEVAKQPVAWSGRLIAIHGLVDDGQLLREGRSLALGTGPWPHAGLVEATGFLQYDDGCLCHRLDAREVRPWTP